MAALAYELSGMNNETKSASPGRRARTTRQSDCSDNPSPSAASELDNYSQPGARERRHVRGVPGQIGVLHRSAADARACKSMLKAPLPVTARRRARLIQAGLALRLAADGTDTTERDPTRWQPQRCWRMAWGLCVCSGLIEGGAAHRHTHVLPRPSHPPERSLRLPVPEYKPQAQVYSRCREPKLSTVARSALRCLWNR